MLYRKPCFSLSHLCDVINYLTCLTDPDVHSTLNISEPELRHRRRRMVDDGWKVLKRGVRREYSLSLGGLPSSTSTGLPNQSTLVIVTVNGAWRYFVWAV